MEFISQLIELIVHLDVHISEIVNHFGAFTYLILFGIIFCETGLFMAPFLPGDSLIFVVGALSAAGTMNIWILTVTLIAAAIIGDTVNYHIGKYLGPKIFQKQNVKLLNKKHLERAHRFYERHGGKTVIIARFIPVIRTFAPFVAGMGSMSYGRFILYNVVGGVLWVSVCISSGYLFGNIPVVKDNFTLVVLAIIFISLLPVFISWLLNNKKRGG
jgi:membrane-associated protein